MSKTNRIIGHVNEGCELRRGIAMREALDFRFSFSKTRVASRRR